METIEDKLASVCWNFSHSETRGSLHSIHPYPAKFIPEIPRNLIALFHPSDDAIVFDPFCGSGTTLLEAKRAGKSAIGVDLNPLSALISKVKTTSLQGDLLTAARETTHIALENIKRGYITLPQIPNVKHWFKVEVQEALAALVSAIDLCTSPDVKDALKIALSSIIVRVSNQDSDTRYAAVENEVTQTDVFAAFERATINLSRVLLNESDGLFPTDVSVRILNKDLMQVEPEEIGRGVGLVVTSPPYPNAYEYWLYHKYRMYWLGMNPVAVRELEIGARPHYFKKNHQTEHDFERQMSRCFWLLSRVMTRGALACFVVGRSIIHGREIDNEALLERAAMPHGFVRQGTAHRRIASSRKSFNLSHGKIQREGIVVFGLEGK